MDRRTKQRIDLQLLCRLGKGAIRSTPLKGITENISRTGILMRWLDAVPLPDVGSSLTVEFTLPRSEDFGPRVMRCQTTVVRITPDTDGQHSVALHIDALRFAPALPPAGKAEFDLESMPPVTKRVS
ncbi:MAG TPA: PilZ domain-containing protein [Bryobacteraceae bacterium]|nr:PilZ domain-containing protein [Bryobacteraceae bacterium]